MYMYVYVHNIEITFISQRALAHDKEHMGKRYIEVFASKYSEMEWVVTRMAGGEGDGEAVVRLRGLPYGAQKQDIAEFFAGRLKFCDSMSQFLDACLSSHFSLICGVFSSHASS